MPTPARDGRHTCFYGIALTYFAIFLDGHPAAPLGLLVPAFWVRLVSHDERRSMDHGEVQLALFALAAIVIGIASTRFERSRWPAQVLQAVSVACFLVSALIAFHITGFLALTLASTMPFWGALFGYFLFALDRRPIDR